MHDRPRVRNPPESRQKRHSLNRENKGQGSSKERLLTTKVTNPPRSGSRLTNTEGINTLYFVKARPIVAKMPRLWTLLNDGTIETQEPDGREILASMRRALMDGDKVEWHETCHCSPPLRHERATVYDQFFSDMEIGPLVSTTPPEGESFWHYFEARNKQTGNRHSDGAVSMTRFVPVRIF